MSLYDYVSAHTIRGACTCGKCCDAPADPEGHQPDGHTADLVFFKVAAKGADKEEFVSLARRDYPHWFDGKEHSYLEIGGDVGDQGAALMTMGLGSLLGAWKLMTPRMLPIPEDLQMQMAGMGMVTIQAAA